MKNCSPQHLVDWLTPVLGKATSDNTPDTHTHTEAASHQGLYPIVFVLRLQVKVTNGKHLINLLEGDGWLTSRPTINPPALIGHPKSFFSSFLSLTIIPETFLNPLGFVHVAASPTETCGGGGGLRGAPPASSHLLPTKFIFDHTLENKTIGHF